MNRNLAHFPKLDSSFLSCEKDLEIILKKLFIQSQPHSDNLKRLLVINTKDCLDNKSDKVYNEKIKSMTVSNLRKEGYIKFEPKIRLPEHEEIKAYIVISFDHFLPNDNPEYRDCQITFDILCHLDYWDIGDYRCRPLKIAGIIDGLLNKQKFSGIGTLQFSGCDMLILDENLAGYTMTFNALHMTDDRLPKND